MNYRYIPNADTALKAIVARRPRAPLHEIHNAHPALQSLSLDQLSLRLDRLNRDPAPGRAL